MDNYKCTKYSCDLSTVKKKIKKVRGCYYS